MLLHQPIFCRITEGGRYCKDHYHTDIGMELKDQYTLILTDKNNLSRVVSLTQEVEFLCVFFSLSHIPILIASIMI